MHGTADVALPLLKGRQRLKRENRETSSHATEGDEHDQHAQRSNRTPGRQTSQAVDPHWVEGGQAGSLGHHLPPLPVRCRPARAAAAHPRFSSPPNERKARWSSEHGWQPSPIVFAGPIRTDSLVADRLAPKSERQSLDSTSIEHFSNFRPFSAYRCTTRVLAMTASALLHSLADRD